jgi:hypothetical protein
MGVYCRSIEGQSAKGSRSVVEVVTKAAWRFTTRCTSMQGRPTVAHGRWIQTMPSCYMICWSGLGALTTEQQQAPAYRPEKPAGAQRWNDTECADQRRVLDRCSLPSTWNICQASRPNLLIHDSVPEMPARCVAPSCGFFIVAGCQHWAPKKPLVRRFIWQSGTLQSSPGKLDSSIPPA